MYNDYPSYSADEEVTEEPVEPVVIGAVAQINLFDRLTDPTGDPTPLDVASTIPKPPRIIPWRPIVGALALLLLVGGGTTAFLLSRSAEKPVVQASAKPTSKPSVRPSAKPTFKPTPKPPAPPPAQRTYTVVSGDTLITIGERLGKDWHAIAAANGNIQDPNLIHPGQVLTIP